jgi:hypothetical protein
MCILNSSKIHLMNYNNEPPQYTYIVSIKHGTYSAIYYNLDDYYNYACDYFNTNNAYSFNYYSNFTLFLFCLFIISCISSTSYSIKRSNEPRIIYVEENNDYENTNYVKPDETKKIDIKIDKK